MAQNFKPVDRSQLYLLPPSIDEWLPQNHLARFILETVEAMNLSSFLGQYRSDGIGSASYHPSLMVATLLYACCIGERSSRRIERNCVENIAFRVLAANYKPDHATIARFFKDFPTELKGLFNTVLELCYKEGLVKVGTVSIDGTKIKANAALDANRTADGLRKALAEEVEKMLAEVQANDAREDTLFGADKRGDELPDALCHPRTRKERIEAGLRRLEQEAREAVEQQQSKIDTRERAEAETGKKIRGRKPAAPESKIDVEAKANITDPASRIMKTRKGFEQAYNAQAAATEEQIILANDVTQDENDQKQAAPMLSLAQAIVASLCATLLIGAALMDAGYWNDASVKLETQLCIELLISPSKEWKLEKALKVAKEREALLQKLPEDLTPKDKIMRRLLTDEGMAKYKIRSQTIEPVFGQIKEVLNGGKCRRRGLEAVKCEWSLSCTAHNLLKIYRSRQA